MDKYTVCIVLNCLLGVCVCVCECVCVCVFVCVCVCSYSRAVLSLGVCVCVGSAYAVDALRRALCEINTVDSTSRVDQFVSLTKDVFCFSVDKL